MAFFSFFKEICIENHKFFDCYFFLNNFANAMILFV
jgi:hypothetical protein